LGVVVFSLVVAWIGGDGGVLLVAGAGLFECLKFVFEMQNASAEGRDFFGVASCACVCVCMYM
jgi:hypothetical protein